MEIRPDKRQYTLKKLTEDKMKAILKDIKEGAPYKHAAEANGISERHFYDMLLQGVCDIEHDKPDTLYARLAQSLRKIEIDDIKSCKEDIRKLKKGHKGAQWILEHVYWRYFGSNAAAIEFDERLRKLEQNKLDKEQSDAISEREGSKN